jgi:hypothetical protein
MSYCCGASTVGYIGSIMERSVLVHQVPLFYCPVCHEVEVHPAVREEFELAVEYAIEDRVKEILFRETITPDMIAEWKEYAVIFQESESAETILREQIDHSLDLMRAARTLKDERWVDELKQRLKVLSDRLKRLQGQREGSK